MADLTAQLASYYDLTVDEPVRPERDNLNNRHFDAAEFVNRHLTDTGLRDLVLLDNDLVSDVKALDSEQQMLVYENYNRSRLCRTVGREAGSRVLPSVVG